MRVRPNSYLRFSDYTEVDGVEFWSTSFPVDLSPRNGDLFHEVVEYDRLDVLADRYYRDPVLKWVILEANNIDLDIVGVDVGMTLRIPSPAYVLSELFASGARF